MDDALPPVDGTVASAAKAPVVLPLVVEIESELTCPVAREVAVELELVPVEDCFDGTGEFVPLLEPLAFSFSELVSVVGTSAFEFIPS